MEGECPHEPQTVAQAFLPVLYDGSLPGKAGRVSMRRAAESVALPSPFAFFVWL